MTLAAERAKAGRRPFAVVELELDYCSLNYGTAPCSAALGPATPVKCYNTPGTCQDTANYDGGALPPGKKVYRFCTNTAEMPRDLDALPLLESVTVAPTKLSIGSGLGERGTATLVLHDGLHHDHGIDKYVLERGYNPLTQGTYLGRLLARNRYFLGRTCRIWRGYLTDGAAGEPVFDFANAEKRVYFLEKAEGPVNGKVTLTAKDPLKRVDDDRALAPIPSQGRLLAGISAVAGSATLKPAGIGDAVDGYGRPYYGASGKVRINGEIMSYTRVGDALTLTARGQNFTTAAAHATDDAVQECLVVSGQPLDAIVYQLLVTYGRIDASLIDTAAWQAERSNYTNGRLYSTVIAEPTGVNTLVNELCEQGPAYFWWDDVSEKIPYRALRPASSAAIELGDAEHFVKGSVKVRSRLDLRVSEVVCLFGQRDPTESLDKVGNYQVRVVRVGSSNALIKYNQSRTKVIYSRWLDAASRLYVEDVADTMLQRYDEAPREIDFTLAPKDAALMTGDLFLGRTVRLQGADGAAEAVTFRALERGGNTRDQFVYSGLEERYSPNASTGERTIVFSAAQHLNVNLRAAHDAQYVAPAGPVTVTFIVEVGTALGSDTLGVPACTAGDWPIGSTIKLVIRGRIQGRGGLAGHGGGTEVGNNGRAGEPGSLALYTRFPITVDNTAGSILGGGGGGGGGGAGIDFPSTFGGGGGGGGQGTEPGEGAPGGSASANGSPGTAATLDAPGIGGNGPNDAGNGGNGGGPAEAGANGQNGDTGSGGPGGAPGGAIDGLSYITFEAGIPGDIRGTQIN